MFSAGIAIIGLAPKYIVNNNVTLNNIFNLWLIKSVDSELMGMEGQ